MTKKLITISETVLHSKDYYQQFVLIDKWTQEWAESNIETFERLKKLLIGKSILKIKEKNICICSSVMLEDKIYITNMIKAYGEVFNIEVETEFILTQY